VKYINNDPPRAAMPKVKGRYEEARVPDTCDLEEAARLFVDGYLTNITVPDPAYYHEPYNCDDLGQDPPRFTLGIGSYLCALPKFREALPLMRTMSGSR